MFVSKSSLIYLLVFIFLKQQFLLLVIFFIYIFCNAYFLFFIREFYYFSMHFIQYSFPQLQLFFLHKYLLLLYSYFVLVFLSFFNWLNSTPFKCCDFSLSVTVDVVVAVVVVVLLLFGCFTPGDIVKTLIILANFFTIFQFMLRQHIGDCDQFLNGKDIRETLQFRQVRDANVMQCGQFATFKDEKVEKNC